MAGNSVWYYIDDEDILSGYRIPSQPRRVRDPDHKDDDELSDYVKFRLWLARQLALKRAEQVLNNNAVQG